jgi:Zn-dependent protease
VRQSLRLGSISGIPVGLNWGLLLIAAVSLLNLAVILLPAAVPDASLVLYWSFAAGNVVLFFASILAHELGHSLVAQRNGIGVKAITLWMLGGVAELEREADDPGVEFRIAIAGPATSLVLAGGFGAVALASSVFVGGGLLTYSLGYLAVLNLVLAVFNMIPAAPLDGGRVLASVLWRRRDNRHAARASAARAGEIFGSVLIAVGLFGLLTGGGTLLIAVLGVFLRGSASAERRRAERLDTLTRSGIEDAMAPLQAPITPGITIAGLESMSAGSSRPVAFPLWTIDGAIGIVSSTVVARTLPSQRASVTVDEFVVEWDRFTSAVVGETFDEVEARAVELGKQHVLVYDRAGNQAGYLDLTELVVLQPS